jgi:hypothetical protein
MRTAAGKRLTAPALMVTGPVNDVQAVEFVEQGT